MTKHQRKQQIIKSVMLVYGYKRSLCTLALVIANGIVKGLIK